MICTIPPPFTLSKVDLLAVLMFIEQLVNRWKVSFLNYFMLLTIYIFALVSASYMSDVQAKLSRNAPSVSFVSLVSRSLKTLVLTPSNLCSLLPVAILRVCGDVLATSS
jgi:hypothetical protein